MEKKEKEINLSEEELQNVVGGEQETVTKGVCDSPTKEECLKYMHCTWSTKKGGFCTVDLEH